MARTPTPAPLTSILVGVAILVGIIILVGAASSISAVSASAISAAASLVEPPPLAPVGGPPDGSNLRLRVRDGWQRLIKRHRDGRHCTGPGIAGGVYVISQLDNLFKGVFGKLGMCDSSPHSGGQMFLPQGCHDRCAGFTI